MLWIEREHFLNLSTPTAGSHSSSTYSLPLQLQSIFSMHFIVNARKSSLWTAITLCIRWKDGATIHYSSSWQEIADKRSQLSWSDGKNKWVILSPSLVLQSHKSHFISTWYHLDKSPLKYKDLDSYPISRRFPQTLSVGFIWISWCQVSLLSGADYNSATLTRKDSQHM